VQGSRADDALSFFDTNPRKPSYILVKWANTVIASWSGEREINWAFIMHKVIHDEVRALGPKKLCYLPSYLAQLYAYGDCQLVIERHHKVLVRRVIKEVYGTSEDEFTHEEKATYEETKEESTEVPLEDYGEIKGGDQSFYMSSDQPQSIDMMEPLMAAVVVDSKVSKPQQSGIDTRGLVRALLNLGERQEEGQR
jgi:hypothetical protein